MSPPTDLGLVDFLRLPKKCHQQILDYLNIWKLMDLRLTCKTTNQWVEESHLHKFNIYVKNYEQLESEVFKKCVTPWKSLILQTDQLVNDVDWMDKPLYSDLLKKLSPSLTSLNIENHRLPITGLTLILSSCQNLKNIEIGTLDCRWWVNSSPENVLKPYNLENFHTGFLAWNEERELQFFSEFLDCNLELVSLKLPHILMAAMYVSGNEDDDVINERYMKLVKDCITDPVIKYMRNPVSKLKRLDVENLHHTEIFPGLLEACFSANTYLENVAEAYTTLCPSDMSALEVIKSLLGFTKFLNFDRLKNLTTIVLDSETSADSEVDEKYICSSLPCLRNIALCLPDDIEKSILQCLFGCERKTVRSLRVEFQLEAELSPNIMFCPTMIAKNLPSLSKLELLDWNGENKDLLVFLRELVNLESLYVQNCPRITDHGFLDQGSQSIIALLNLRRLKDLWLDCQISDLVLRNAVRHLELESLFYCSEKITMLGFLSLSQGAIAKTLIKFPVMEPDGMTPKVRQDFLKHMKNLKRFPTPAMCKIVQEP